MAYYRHAVTDELSSKHCTRKRTTKMQAKKAGPGWRNHEERRHVGPSLPSSLIRLILLSILSSLSYLIDKIREIRYAYLLSYLGPLSSASMQESTWDPLWKQSKRKTRPCRDGLHRLSNKGRGGDARLRDEPRGELPNGRPSALLQQTRRLTDDQVLYGLGMGPLRACSQAVS